MKSRFKALGTRTKAALIGAVIFTLYLLTYRLFGLPSNEELVIIARDLYTRHGYLVAYCASVLEALLLLGLYLPGSGVVLLGAVFSSEGILDIRFFTLASIAGFITAYIMNYSLGRFGWYHLLIRFGLSEQIEAASERLKGTTTAKQVWLFGMGYFHPNAASVLATTAGILRIPFGQFVILSVIATSVWNSLWATLAFVFGDTVIRILTSWLIIPAVFLLIVISNMDFRRISANIMHLIRLLQHWIKGL